MNKTSHEQYTDKQFFVCFLQKTGPLKEEVEKTFLNHFSLEQEDLNTWYCNYKLAANLPYLCKFIEYVASNQIQVLLDEADFLNPFKLGS